jgi:hypothetical protein
LPTQTIVAVLSLSAAAFCWAQKGTYSTLDQILEQAFADGIPETHTLWLPQEIKQEMQSELGFEPRGLRQRYWQSGDRTLWILEEIGKEYPITFAYVVENNRIVSASVMEYRESRGGEIRHSFFRQQFENSHLERGKLDRHIDGITGATLSVSAMTKMAKQALWFHAEAIHQSELN